MGRLQTVPGRLSAPAPRIGAPAGDPRAQDKIRDHIKPWRKWYGLKRWKDLRLEILKAAGYTCAQTGVALVGAPGAHNSPVIDHVKEHKGDPDLFWDPANLQAVSKEYHDREKQRLERQAAR